MTGVGFVTVTYVLINIAYLAVLPIEDVKNSEAIAIDFAVAATGASWPSKIIALFVALSAAGACNASILAGARVSYVGTSRALTLTMRTCV